MILALDTSTPVCHAWLIVDETPYHFEWNANRQLADGIFGFLRQSLASLGKSWPDIEAIIAYQGPGSFTGLRIGLTVLNTIADTSSIPIVGVTGDAWLDAGRARLAKGENDRLVMPLYGREPNITKPRK